MANLDLIQYVLHTINPVLYMMLYYIFIPTKIDHKYFLIGIIFPVIYIILVYSFIEPFLGNHILNAFSEFEVSQFVYPFLDPMNYESYPNGTLFFVLFTLGISVSALSFLLNLLKNKLENSMFK